MAGIDPATGKVSKTTLNLGNLPPRKGSVAPVAFPRTPTRVNPNQPPWPAFRGYHEYSFAHAVMGVRLPTILHKAIQDVYLTLNAEYEEERITDLLKCVDRMEVLMDDLQGNAKLRPIIDDGAGDVALWNKEISKYFKGKDFMNAPWLFAEAYKYRRLRECFSLSKFWVEYDVFFRQKCDTFSRSAAAVMELASRFAEPATVDKSLSPEDQRTKNKLIFHELAQICLWGNSTDLSLLIDMTEDDIKALQSTGGDHLAATEKNILGNDLKVLGDLVTGLKGGRIDFILDNAGFELYTDLVFADWLIQSGICREVHFHGKILPWFVSDVRRQDWNWILNQCVYGHLFQSEDQKNDVSEEDVALLRILGKRWKQFEAEGKFQYHQHPFWCTGFTFWHLNSEAPDLWDTLCESDLVIFKGDLNHRKLTYDCHAPASTPFAQAIGPLASEPGAPPICSLRTIKSDVVVGLPEGVAEHLDETETENWKISGKYAVVLLSRGDKGVKI
ncbi:uncharacterized protein CcaverHIS019_0604190 [Cutaneotrichosporon cavernicola]|uniref:Sugar phosphate phosphatase n=1 Tax=Cutaneotrichosporon cavernicola TaxID=279322 RepID=A0AA48QY40_9TREE|nr:uncharacterized protein CcaverHIS019_0604190 [Cutaneotrichosporon cavernicola]BEI93960.1 hypothetical protein CcaverHIS019_0604190 [Cutaneotrichosporon cavernicola]BEJ01741.1 hypothetical protein CcaverHIS631_0604230 [Cutaneotrichosporon cavernicola]BEJ09508.1 hypothetical protein CcaverHIS641_0604230 [Cutaneotrichosporon cavernicola]